MRPYCSWPGCCTPNAADAGLIHVDLDDMLILTIERDRGRNPRVN
ncbi:hypothetical protein N5079_19325 [Planotetraspora sp. A-T 1434]|nr:hypothetical protein [Planotetraspora sp. A-T 1434]MCT9932358.1 hypothetical protein [Planotetraspora sp. A-T 1434]